MRFSFIRETRSPNEKTSSHTEVKLPATKQISIKDLESYEKISITAKEDAADVKYDGVAMRVLLKEFMPDKDLDSKDVVEGNFRRELVMEVTADDNYSGLATAMEVAMNKAGDKFVLATHKNGQVMDGVRLICKMDEHRTRWVQKIAILRLVEVLKAKSTSK